MQPVHVGLWDQYGGSMPSGWTRFLMEQFEFPFEVVYPLSNHIVGASGGPIPREQYFIPGSLLAVRLDNTLPVTYGMADSAIVTFDESPVFRLQAGAAAQGVRPVAWFATDHPLVSGWAWGQEHLKDGVAAVAADVGRGKLFVLGPEVLFRGQPHGTFKLVFNGIQLSTSRQGNVN
jgi:hypothetical protein